MVELMKSTIMLQRVASPAVYACTLRSNYLCGRGGREVKVDLAEFVGRLTSNLERHQKFLASGE